MRVNELRKIKNETLKGSIDNIVKLEMVYHLDDLGAFEGLSDVMQEKLVLYAYNYWIWLDSLEHTLYDYIEALVNSHHYIGIDLIDNIEKLDYKSFRDLINEMALL